MARLVEEGCCWGNFVIGIWPGASLRTFSEYKLQKVSAWMPWLLTYVSDPWYSAICCYIYMWTYISSFVNSSVLCVTKTHLIHLSESQYTKHRGFRGGRHTKVAKVADKQTCRHIPLVSTAMPHCYLYLYKKTDSNTTEAIQHTTTAIQHSTTKLLSLSHLYLYKKTAIPQHNCRRACSSHWYLNTYKNTDSNSATQGNQHL